MNKDINISFGLPSSFYTEDRWFDRAREAIFSATWQYVPEVENMPEEVGQFPVSLLPGYLDEPLVVTRDEHGEERCLSNVCTHRGMLLVAQHNCQKKVVCPYHGRSFDLKGKMLHMPAFDKAENFPSAADDLPEIPIKKWAGLHFASLDPGCSFEDWLAPVISRVDFLPTDQLVYSEHQSKDYFVDAHWALYCDNYLDGLHIPFVHPGLNQSLDFGQYSYELFTYGNLQLGIASDDEADCFEIPQGHVDHGKKVYAYYFWLFPNLMLNFYPWGLSLNWIQPLSKDRTKVSFRTYTFQGATVKRPDQGLDDTELEDEYVVNHVQKGMRSQLYQKGRFSPTHEQCVHHFHLLLDQFANITASDSVG